MTGGEGVITTALITIKSKGKRRTRVKLLISHMILGVGLNGMEGFGFQNQAEPDMTSRIFISLPPTTTPKLLHYK